MAADDERPGPGADPRTLALSDGVFAIAMTLLVLSIGMPRPGRHEQLGAALWDHRGVAFLPYPTQVLGTYGSRPAAVGLYAGTTALVSGAGRLMARHARDARVLWPGTEHAPAPGDHWWTVPAILLLAIPLSLLVGGWALLLWLLLPLARRA
jgi:TMEM175 potassium channel family protein